LLGEQIEVAILVHIGKAEPFPNIETGIAAGAVFEPGDSTLFADSPEERHLPSDFLNEEIPIAIPIGVDQLRPRRVEPAEEGEIQRLTGCI
jgi:hypothetical protein